MTIILEGPDSAGKSTLAKKLAAYFPDYSIYHSSGPERYPGEINERIGHLPTSRIIFDRHPTVSHVIYGGKTPIDRDLFLHVHAYSPRQVLVLPDPCPLGPQEATEYNTPEHLRYVEENHHKIIDRYRLWAQLFCAFHYDRTNFEELLQWLNQN